MKRQTTKIWLLIFPGAALLGFAIYAGRLAWAMAGDTVMGASGIVAMILAITLTLALAGALVTLLIYSERHGYDR